MLTLEQIEIGRGYLREADRDGDAHDLEEWCRQHAAELLDAAERVARDDYHARAHREAVWAGEAPERRPTPREIGEAAAAEDRARGATYKGPPVPPHLLDEVEDDAAFVRNELAAGAKLLADAERRKAAARFEELREECARQFHGRPLIADDGWSTDPHAVRPRDVKAWLRGRGLVAGVFIQSNDRSQVVIDPQRVLR